MTAVATATAATVTVERALLDPLVEGLLIQFSFRARDLVSPWLWSKEAENLRARKERKERNGNGGGMQFILPTKNTGVLDFIRSLKADGWVITDALSQVRADPAPERRGKNYYMVKFQFHQTPLQTPVEPSLAEIIAKHYEPSLLRLAASTLWRVRAYRNPLQRESGTPRSGISINCDAWGPTSFYEGCRHLRLLNNRIVLV